MSGLGKGITAASTGRLLKNAGMDVTAVKIDPYINVDAGTMNPFEHGEVFVLKDGGEVDLDLGNYERFLDVDMTSEHNITTGKVFKNVIERERKGDYLGKTVQIIPHITDDIKRRLHQCGSGHDVCIVELGGTVGDIESMAFLEAVRQMHSDLGPDELLLIHVSLVPVTNNGEQKTKPTQHSVQSLREIGLQPDIIVGRSGSPLEKSTREKISLFCDVVPEAVISAPDLEDIYHVPLTLEEEGLDDYVTKQLNLPRRQHDTSWRDIVTRGTRDQITVALAGKYDFKDAYLSIHEALKHAGFQHQLQVNVLWVDCDDMSEKDHRRLRQAQAVIVPGGFGERGTEGKIKVIKNVREAGLPFLGICFGFQLAVVEFARNVVGLTDAHSTEVKENTDHPVIDLLPDQYDVENMGGTMRLGDKETTIEASSRAHEIYGSTSVIERHRHRFEVNPEYIDTIEEHGMKFTGRSNHRMEIFEIPEHPFFIGTQFHPEFKSRPTRPSPPFVSLVEAALEFKQTPRSGEPLTSQA